MSKPVHALAVLALVLLAACGGDSAESLMKSGKDYLAKNDSKSAVIQFKSVLQKDPQSAEARFLLGKTLLETGDAVSAVVELRKALDLKHPQAVVLPVLARALIVEGQAKRLTESYDQTVLSDPGAEADLKTSLAVAWGMQGDKAKAQRALQTALEASPTFAPALLFNARLKADARDVDGAFALIDQVLAKDPKDHEAWHLKGELSAALRQDNKAAIEAFRQAVAAKPNYVPSYSRMITLMLGQGELAPAKEQLAAMRKLAPNQPQVIYLDTLVAVAERDFKGAREKVQALLRSAPDNLNVLQLAGSIEMQLNSLLQAEALLNKVLAAAPGQVITRRQLAQIAVRSGQPAKALTLLQPLFDKDGGAVGADFAVAAEAHLLSGDAKKAEEFFSRAAKLDPKDVRSRTAVALSKMQASGGDSLSELQSIAAADSGVFADMALVATHVRRRDFDNALAALDAVQKKQPNSVQPELLRARVHTLRNDLKAARTSFDAALKIDPKSFPAVAGLAGLDLADKQPDAARQRFEDLLKLEPKSTQALLALASLRQRAGAGKEEVATLFANAVKVNPTELAPRQLLVEHHLANKDFKLALSAAQDAVAALPNSPEALDALGRAQALSGDIQQALSSFNKMAALQPQSPQPHLRLADVYMNQKNPESAASSLKRALGITPNLLQAQQALIQIEVAGKRHVDAIAIAREVQKQRPLEAAGYLLESEIDIDRRNWTGAEAALRNGLKQAPSTDMAARLHGVLRGGAAKAAEADRFAATWSRDRPQDAGFQRYLGDVALRERKPAEAEAKYRQALRVAPNDPLAMNNLAYLLASQKKPGALVLAQKAAELLPNAAVLDTLALAQSEEGQMPAAVETMKKALALAPNEPALQLNLARLYIKAGDKAAAKKELEAIAKLGDKFGGQAVVADLLKTL